ncbi:hypothetical protein NPIL_267661 [Nephila pilipes]|uniref:Uncharacterized protein n=1 Tax=Nephila pilipes TaxID=299642 RepID=A0A8X6T0A2_NEPPI|nr:hypothetical protein NPIL_267661 [Nephila pilipes]
MNKILAYITGQTLTEYPLPSMKSVMVLSTFPFQTRFTVSAGASSEPEKRDPLRASMVCLCFMNKKCNFFNCESSCRLLCSFLLYHDVFFKHLHKSLPLRERGAAGQVMPKEAADWNFNGPVATCN